MAISKRKGLTLGCVVLPVMLFTSCIAKMNYDSHVYYLPGATLASSMRPTQDLDTAMQVAEALDSYVQPRFEILRDRSFGAMRIVFRKHAGVVQLKVESEREKATIANVNAAGRDYSISLLHCAPTPYEEEAAKAYSMPLHVEPYLRLLYFNQQKLVEDYDYYRNRPTDEQTVKDRGLNFDALSKTSSSVVSQLRTGREYRTRTGDWAVLIRPVLASKQACLDCHKTAKRGDILGAMVYAVREGKRAVPSRIGMR